MALKLLICALILLICIVSQKITNRLGVPSLLLFIALGMIFGSDGIFKIPFDNYVFAEQVCSIALIFIIFYGGFGTNWKMAKQVIGKSITLSTLGVILTAISTGFFCHFILKIEILESFLIGAVISSTDAASVFSILRSKKLNLKDGTASILEVESGSNDPFAYMLTMIILTLMSSGGLAQLPSLLFTQIVFGLVIGVLVAFMAIYTIQRTSFLHDGLDVIFVLAIAIIAYALPSVLNGNGYLGTYIAGIIIGNSKIKNKISLVHFFDGITGLAQMFIFFLLGLLAFPSQMPAIIVPAILIFIFLTFIARPLAVFLLLSPIKCSMNQKLLISWAGLRGASSIVFAIMAMLSESYMKNDVFHIVFCLCLISVAFQGTLLPHIAHKLNMVDDDSDVLKTFTDYQDETKMQLIKITVNASHHWVGQMISELNLIDTLVVMIKRDNETIIPHGNTVIEANDLLVLSGEGYEDNDPVKLNELKIEAGHRWLDRPIKDLPLPSHTLIILIKRADGTTIIPKGETCIKLDDILVLSDI